MATVDHEFWEDLRWGERHHTDLLKQFRDQWVAVHRKQVVASGTNLQEVREVAKKKAGTDQVPVLFVECGAHIYGQG